MKHHFFFTLFILSSTLSFAQEITFETDTIDYGIIEKGSDGKRIFKFTNTGKNPLVISTVKGNCGCNTATHPKELILTGESSEIISHYDTSRKGYFVKYFSVTSNDKNAINKQLVIKGTVIDKE